VNQSFQMQPGVARSLASETVPIVRCAGLVKRFGNVTALAGVDLEVRNGECLGLLGPNGAGKTTVVETIEGLSAPDEGFVELFGLRWGSGHDYSIRNRMGVQLQETRLLDKLTVEETVRLFRSFYVRGLNVDELIASVRLSEKKRAYTVALSGGQRQRLALACALAGAPALLLLDEPTAGLDPQARLNLWEIVEQFRAKGGTVLLTTHHMDEAARLCDRVAIIDHGSVIALGRPAELVLSLAASQVINLSLKGELDESKLKAIPGVGSLHQADNNYALIISDVGAALPEVLSQIQRQQVELIALTTHQATLEDVFFSLTGRTLRDP